MQPIALHIGSFAIRYAGLMYLVAIVGSLLYARRVAERRRWNSEAVLPGVAVVAAAAYVGARILAAFTDPFTGGVILEFSRGGGLSFFGGLALGSGAMVAYLHWVRLPVGAVTDELAVIAPIVYAVFRLGCFLNGDDYGVPTSLPWGMSFPHGEPPTAERVHPVQLYEVGLMLPVWLAIRSRRYETLPDGTRSFDLCILLGLERFLIEFLRPAFLYADYLANAQWFALALIAVGVTGRFRLRVMARR